MKLRVWYTDLARSANLPTRLYILPSVIFSSSFLLGAKLSQYLMDRFSRSFYQMEGICVNFLYRVHFFRFLKGRCYGNQFCVVLDLGAWSRSISASAGPIFTIFHHMVGIELQMIIMFYIFRCLKGRCHGNQFSGKNGAKLPPALIALSFRNGMG